MIASRVGTLSPPGGERGVIYRDRNRIKNRQQGFNVFPLMLRRYQRPSVRTYGDPSNTTSYPLMQSTTGLLSVPRGLVTNGEIGSMFLES